MIAVNSAWNIHNFRLGLISSLLKEGYEVVSAAPRDYCTKKIESCGCRFTELPVDNDGTNIARDFILFIHFLKLFLFERPHYFLSFTIKPNIYGSFAAHILGINVINNVSGLGSVFIKKSLLTHFVCFLYKLAFSQSKCIFFQNLDDRLLFLEKQIVSSKYSLCLPGSGVDINKFTPLPFVKKRKFRFLMISRLLWDKGVKEFVEATKLLKRRGFSIECSVLGFVDAKNPSAISTNYIKSWISDGTLTSVHYKEDVRSEIIEADCVVLPSYREGTPKSLLEAAAMGRPIITTDTPGCRDVVDDGLNGFLCVLKDVGDLANKMEKMVLLGSAKRKKMGIEGRKKIEASYDEKIVFRKYKIFMNRIKFEFINNV